MSKNCNIKGCKHPQYEEGVCLWHYPIWEHWGYEEGGYDHYLNYGRTEGRKEFEKWLNSLNHQKTIDILTGYDWRLTQAVNEA